MLHWFAFSWDDAVQRCHFMERLQSPSWSLCFWSLHFQSVSRYFLCWKLLCSSAINAFWHVSEHHWNMRGIFYHQTRALLSQIRKFSSHELIQAVQCPLTVAMDSNALLCGVSAARTSQLAFLSPVQVRGAKVWSLHFLRSSFPLPISTFFVTALKQSWFGENTGWFCWIL